MSAAIGEATVNISIKMGVAVLVDSKGASFSTDLAEDIPFMAEALVARARGLA